MGSVAGLVTRNWGKNALKVAISKKKNLPSIFSSLLRDWDHERTNRHIDEPGPWSPPPPSVSFITSFRLFFLRILSEVDPVSGLIKFGFHEVFPNQIQTTCGGGLDRIQIHFLHIMRLQCGRARVIRHQRAQRLTPNKMARNNCGSTCGSLGQSSQWLCYSGATEEFRTVNLNHFTAPSSWFSRHDPCRQCWRLHCYH